jgi:hypothetical protein
MILLDKWKILLDKWKILLDKWKILLDKWNDPVKRDRYSPASSSCLAVACRRRWCDNYGDAYATAYEASLSLFIYKYQLVFIGR